MPKKGIHAQIEEVFANTPGPGEGFDEISASIDDEGIVNYFRGTRWRGHQVQALRIHSVALSLFTDKAFRYWLPAFMLAELENAEAADILGEGIAFHLTDAESAEARLRQFTRPELEAIAGFFDECARRNGDGIYDARFLRAANLLRARMGRSAGEG